MRSLYTTESTNSAPMHELQVTQLSSPSDLQLQLVLVSESLRPLSTSLFQAFCCELLISHHACHSVTVCLAHSLHEKQCCAWEHVPQADRCTTARHPAVACSDKICLFLAFALISDCNHSSCNDSRCLLSLQYSLALFLTLSFKHLFGLRKEYKISSQKFVR